MYYSTTYLRNKSKLLFATFGVFNVYLALSLGKFVFQTPLQAAQQRNFNNEYQHVYVMAMLNRGRGLQEKIDKRLEKPREEWQAIKDQAKVLKVDVEKIKRDREE